MTMPLKEDVSILKRPSRYLEIVLNASMTCYNCPDTETTVLNLQPVRTKRK